MSAEPGTEPREETSSLELVFHHEDRLRELCTLVCSTPARVIRLAYAITLQTYFHTESTHLAVSEKPGNWSTWKSVIFNDNTVLELIDAKKRAHCDDSNISPEADLADPDVRFGLSISLPDVFETEEDTGDLFSDLRHKYTELKALVTAVADPFTGGLLLKLVYLHASFSDSRASSILSTLSHILEELLSYPSTRLKHLELVNEQDYQQCLSWSGRPPKAVERCVHDMIHRHALVQPSSAAVDAWDGELTHAQLDDTARRVAYQLAEKGVLSGTPVAICFEKSLWYIVAVLGVLKAGAAFVPLDPSQPGDRLRSIVQQTKAKIILASRLQADLAGGLAETVIVVDQTSLKTTPLPTSWDLPTTTPWDLAYILFTSGSTGSPKGVMIEHSAACSSAVYHGRATGVSNKTRALQFARPTFDASIGEIITTLIHGGCVVVPSEEQRMNNITSVIRDKHVNWAFFTPSLIRLLDPTEVPGLQTLILGGESVAKDNIDVWAPGRNLFNGYGPTENTVFSVMCALPPKSKAGRIGRAVGSACWVADPQNPNRLMPAGATGELLLEGPQLARGYLGFRENEGPNTAFIWDPPWLVRQGRRGRLYRTGDLCRFDQSGNIHYEGRKDNQLKISGQRLEAGEVEHHLRGAFGTPHVVVDTIERPTSGSSTTQTKALVAYVCLETDEEAFASTSKTILPAQDARLVSMIPAVEARLAKILPAWMIPSVYIPLRTIPLGATGKADNKRLRAETSKLSAQEFSAFMLYTPEADSSESPQNPRLRLLRNLWAGVLGIDLSLVSRKSSFFRLGGDSITAMRLVAAARKARYIISVAEIFRTPALEEQCNCLREDSDDPENAVPRIDQYELLPEGDTMDMLREIAQECGIRPDSIEDAFPCTPLQEGFMALTTGPSSYVAQHVISLAPETDIKKLKAAWETVARAYGILRTRIVHILNAGMVQVVVDERLEWHESSNLVSYLESDLKKPTGFGLPLNRFGIVREPESDHQILVWSGHHAVIDGHSVSLTLCAVRDAYGGDFQPTIAEFTNFIKHIRDIDPQATAQYWRSKFQGGKCAVFPKLPSASYSPEPKSYVKRRLSVPVHNLGVTRSTILRAAWALVVALFSGSDDVVFGVTSTGRNTTVTYVESILGPTIATVPLRVKCSTGLTVQELLNQIQVAAIDMIPFEQAGLQTISRLSADCDAACAFQSLLIVQPEEDMGLSDSIFANCERTQELGAFNAYAIMVECDLEKNGGVHLNVNYDNVVVADTEMARLVDYLEAAVQFLCLESVQSQPIQKFTDQLLPSEIATIQTWNATEPHVVNACAHTLFEENVRSQPEKQVIFAWDGCLTYGELDNIASRLARKLVELGVGPEITVPYCFEKSKFTVVAMLAILKAGGTMVPLDPTHPPGRRRFIIEKVGARVVTASASNAGNFKGLGLDVVTVNQELIEKLEEENVEPFSSNEVHPSHAATILFTSGSTGTPKGVVQEHRTLCSAAYGESGPMLMRKSSRILQFSAHVFDVSIIEIVNALVLGATLCIPSEEDRTGNLPAFVAKSKADWAFFTPSFAATLKPAHLPALKSVNLGGEAVDRENIATWVSHVNLVNAYGPCEAAVCITANLNDGNATTDSIGHGANCLVWLAHQDDHDRLVPLGSVGEILLEGPNVARGYYGDEDRTRQAFITNPRWMVHFEKHGRTRVLYKTGDLGRFNADGSVVYLGRKDTQVKIRGQRVELGEIEHHLCESLPEGSAVAADAITLPSSTTKALVAIVRLGHQGQYTQVEQAATLAGLADNLKHKLGVSLPAYMVPSAFIPIESMPFSSTGKLDRKSLREYASSLSASAIHGLTSSGRKTVGAEPLQESEEIAIAISRVLGDLLSVTSPEYGNELRGQNFNPYQAGMDSIQVISLSTFVRKAYGVILPVQKYMTSRATVRDIAGWIENAKEERELGAETPTPEDRIDFLNEIEKYDAQIMKESQVTKATAPKQIPETVLLTGATGFLGSQILIQLLQRRQTRMVSAVVRGRDAAHARERLLSVIRSTPQWQEAYAARIEVWHGDLAAPRLGLQDDAQWDRLCHRSPDPADDIDAIIHNGAVVHWLADYTALTPANIVSTVDLLRAVTEANTVSNRPAPRFTYVSGGHLSTAPDDIEQIAKEMNTSAYPAYSQTKFVAENLALRYAEWQAARSLPRSVSIVKPGLIMGDSVNGIANTDDFLWRVTASALDTGIYNDHEDETWLTAAGVDLVARIVIASCFDNELERPTVKKVLSGLRVGEFWRIVTEETGRVVSGVEAGKWASSMRDHVNQVGRTHRLWPVLHLLNDEGVLGQPLNGLSESVQREQQEAVRAALRKSLRYLVAVGYMQSGSTSSDDEEGGQARSSLLSPTSSVFTRTPTTPLWELTNVSAMEANGYKDTLDVVTPLRMPSPESAAIATLGKQKGAGYFGV